ncbi:hypothetical protein V8G54_015378 [Vigna mungo]|uniref:Uncharacterized protein n=1 Tax=Vigna mungo TaxID=3915 RepID=A0AAQ3RZG5_VIGMU
MIILISSTLMYPTRLRSKNRKACNNSLSTTTSLTAGVSFLVSSFSSFNRVSALDSCTSSLTLISPLEVSSVALSLVIFSGLVSAFASCSSFLSSDALCLGLPSSISSYSSGSSSGSSSSSDSSSIFTTSSLSLLELSFSETAFTSSTWIGLVSISGGSLFTEGPSPF